MKNLTGELRGFMVALIVGLPVGILTWLVAYALALFIFPHVTGIDLPGLRPWL